MNTWRKYQTLNALLLTVIVLFGTSCATILNSKQQTVTLESDPDAEIYVDGKKIGKGSVKTELARDQQVRQIKIEKEGYNPIYDVAVQTKKSPLYVMSWIPFGALLLLPPLTDGGEKAFDYKSNISFDKDMIKARKRSEDQKYLYVNNTSFSVDKGGFRIMNYSSPERYKNEHPRYTRSTSERFTVENSDLTDNFNALLQDHNYIDTTSKILKNKSNTVHVNATVDNINVHYIDYERGYGASRYMSVGLQIHWELLNVYNMKLYEDRFTTRSGEMSLGYFSVDKGLEKAFEHSLRKAFFKFVADKEVQKLLKKESVESNKPEKQLTLREPASEPASLAEAQAAAVTIILGETHGSGVVVSNKGHIITNYHVVTDTSKEIKVETKQGIKHTASIERVNKTADLALLKIDKTFDNYFKLPSGKNYEVGEEVYAIGTPTSVSLGQTVNKGIISGVREQENFTWIQTDVSINPGNSGGPLVTKNGKLLGVVNKKVVGLGVEGISFCIPAYKVPGYLNLSY